MGFSPANLTPDQEPPWWAVGAAGARTAEPRGSIPSRACFSRTCLQFTALSENSLSLLRPGSCCGRPPGVPVPAPPASLQDARSCRQRPRQGGWSPRLSAGTCLPSRPSPSERRQETGKGWAPSCLHLSPATGPARQAQRSRGASAEGILGPGLGPLVFSSLSKARGRVSCGPWLLCRVPGPPPSPQLPLGARSRDGDRGQPPGARHSCPEGPATCPCVESRTAKADRQRPRQRPTSPPALPQPSRAPGWPLRRRLGGAWALRGSCALGEGHVPLLRKCPPPRSSAGPVGADWMEGIPAEGAAFHWYLTVALMG